MVFVPVLLLNIIWLISSIIWFRTNPSGWNSLRFFLRLAVIIISLVSLYPFIKLIFPILTESEEDFLPSSYNFFFFFIIFLYVVLLIIYPPFFVPFFIVFIVFSGFASIIELKRGIKDKNLIRLIIPSFNLFGKLYFVYLFPSILEIYVFISYILIIVDLILWYIFLKDHKLFFRMKILYRSVINYFVQSKFKKTYAVITLLVLTIYLFSWPIYTEFWESLIIVSPDLIFRAITNESIEPSNQYQLILLWFPIIGLIGFIIGIICALIYLMVNRE